MSHKLISISLLFWYFSGIIFGKLEEWDVVLIVIRCLVINSYLKDLSKICFKVNLNPTIIFNQFPLRFNIEFDIDWKILKS